MCVYIYLSIFSIYIYICIICVPYKRDPHPEFPCKV